jgi:hypothetical protein
MLSLTPRGARTLEGLRADFERLMAEVTHDIYPLAMRRMTTELGVMAERLRARPSIHSAARRFDRAARMGRKKNRQSG